MSTLNVDMIREIQNLVLWYDGAILTERRSA